MSKRIYVGNLPFSVSGDEVQDWFKDFGEVESVKLVTDRETKRPRGFGFVEMKDDDEAVEAIQALDGKDKKGRGLKVSEVMPRGERRRTAWH
jgi:RNA recognition motif-containing protein